MGLLLQGHLQPPSVQIRQNNNLAYEKKMKNTLKYFKNVKTVLLLWDEQLKYYN